MGSQGLVGLRVYGGFKLRVQDGSGMHKAAAASHEPSSWVPAAVAVRPVPLEDELLLPG